MAAMLVAAMASCEIEPFGNGNDSTNNNNNENPPSAQTDTTIMSFTMLRSLINIDWEDACAIVLAKGFTEFESDEDNVRAFLRAI